MREIKFRVWSIPGSHWWTDETVYMALDGHIWLRRCEGGPLFRSNIVVMQYTGLKDKNGLTDIYEGDIIDLAGNMKGNIYETPNRQATDLVIEGMGTATWRDTEQAAMERGCQYSE